MAFVYRVFLKGVVALLPISVTIYLLAWIAGSAESAFGEPLKSSALYFPGAGIFIAVLLVFLVGLLVNNYLTQRFIEWIESRLAKTPVIRSIYGPIRDVTKLFSREDSNSNQRVVMVDWHGIEVMGLITRDQFEDLPPGSIPSDSCTVFVPFSYGVGGFTLIVSKSRLRETAIPAEKAMQLAITGWIKSTRT